MILKNKSFWYLIFILSLTKTEISFSNHKKSRINIIATEDAFLSLLDSEKNAILFGSMDNCPNCSVMNPEFEKLSKNPTFKNIDFHKANGPELNLHKHIKRESKDVFKVPGYPIFVFIKNKKIDNVVIGANIDKLTKSIKDFADNI